MLIFMVFILSILPLICKISFVKWSERWVSSGLLHNASRSFFVSPVTDHDGLEFVR